MRRITLVAVLLLALLACSFLFAEARKREIPKGKVSKSGGDAAKRAAAAEVDDDDDDDDESVSNYKKRNAAADDEDEEDEEDEDETDDERAAEEQARAAAEAEAQQEAQHQQEQMPLDENWRNTELTTDLWRYISSGNTEEVEKMVERDARIALVRAEDGRGPLFWAYEFKRSALVKFLISAGARTDAKDVNGAVPADMAV